MIWQAGDTYPANVTVRDDDGELVDPDTLSLSVRDPEGDVTTYVYGTDAEVVRDSLGVYHVDVEIGTPGMWVFAWSTTNEEQVEGVQIAVSPAPTVGVTFATIAELALRLGQESADDLTAAQRAKGQMLLEFATGLIVVEVGKTDAWAQTLDPINRVLRGVCLEVVARVMQSPAAGITSESETLGAYSHTTRYEGGGSNGSAVNGLALTEEESRKCRRAVWGSVSGSAYPIAALSAD